MGFQNESVRCSRDGCCCFVVQLREAGRCLMGVQGGSSPMRLGEPLAAFQGHFVSGPCLPCCSELGICCVPALVAVECM